MGGEGEAGEGAGLDAAALRQGTFIEGCQYHVRCFLFFCAFVFVVITSSFSLSRLCLSLCLGIFLSVSFSVFLCLSVFLSVSLSVSLSVCVSIRSMSLCVYLSLRPSLSLSVCLCLCVSIPDTKYLFISLPLSRFLPLSSSLPPSSPLSPSSRLLFVLHTTPHHSTPHHTTQHNYHHRMVLPDKSSFPFFRAQR